MTCAQGLLRLLWGGGGPKLECYGTAVYNLSLQFFSMLMQLNILHKLHITINLNLPFPNTLII